MRRRGIVRPLLMAAIAVPYAAGAAVAEAYDWARPHATAAGLRLLAWMGEGRRG